MLQSGMRSPSRSRDILSGAEAGAEHFAGAGIVFFLEMELQPEPSRTGHGSASLVSVFMTDIHPIGQRAPCLPFDSAGRTSPAPARQYSRLPPIPAAIRVSCFSGTLVPPACIVRGLSAPHKHGLCPGSLQTPPAGCVCRR